MSRIKRNAFPVSLDGIKYDGVKSHRLSRHGSQVAKDKKDKKIK
jgi:hypothetical protein